MSSPRLRRHSRSIAIRLRSRAGQGGGLERRDATVARRRVVFTDDDARFEVDWLDQALKALEDSGGDYVGGKVLPIWGGSQPGWLANRPGQHGL